MTQINPLTGSILQSPVVQQHQAIEKDRQIRRAQNLRKNIALQDDQLEHQVESSEALSPAHGQQEDDARNPSQRHQPPKSQSDDKPHIDLTA